MSLVGREGREGGGTRHDTYGGGGGSRVSWHA